MQTAKSQTTLHLLQSDYNLCCWHTSYMDSEKSTGTDHMLCIDFMDSETGREVVKLFPCSAQLSKKF